MAQKPKKLATLLTSFIVKKTAHPDPIVQNNHLPVRFQKKRKVDEVKPNFEIATRNLHVSNFGEETTESEIKEMFEKHADVNNVIMIRGRYCFVNTSSIEGATKARDALQGATLRNKSILINFAKDKFQNQPPRSGFEPRSKNQHSRDSRIEPRKMEEGAARDRDPLDTKKQSVANKNAQEFDPAGSDKTSKCLRLDMSNETRDSLMESFSKFGEVKSVTVKEDCSFVLFVSAQDAITALEALSIQGRTARFATPEEEDEKRHPWSK